MKKIVKCDRCGTDLNGKCFTMSRFNTDYLCMSCKEEETQHPDYQLAVEAERAELAKGNWNYPGIGYPGKNGRI